jgi:pyruvate dehydrogenase E2 component (dihydrolipoamide acetyltransferase)
MATKVVLAKLSPTMEEGLIVKWLKREGDSVKVGDVLAEVETDKANMEMESLVAGTLLKIFVPAGGKAPVAAIIAAIGTPGEDVSSLAPASAAPPASAPPAPAAPAPSAPVTLLPAPPSSTAPSAGEGRIKSSPLARKVAAEKHVTIAEVPGTGPGGRIVKRDVEAFASQHVASVHSTASTAFAPGVSQVVPLSGMRKTIAKRLSESFFGAPHFYVTVDVDMARVTALRADLKEAGEKISVNDFIVRACARALRLVPQVNASWGPSGDSIVMNGSVDIGIAVAIPDGLMTPVVRFADQKSLGAISAEIRELASRAKEKKLKPEEYTGATFSISNLGMMDVEEFTAIVNPPGSAILSVGATRKEPVVNAKDEIVIGHRMKITLGSDHRVIDGAVAAQFLGEVKRLLQNPVALLV